MTRRGRLAWLLLTPVLCATPALADIRFDAATGTAKAKMLTAPSEAEAAARRAERFAAPAGPARARDLAMAKWLQGEAALRQNAAARAAPLIDAAIGLLKDDRPSKLRGDLLLSRGALDEDATDVSAALTDYQTAYDIFGAVGATRSQAIALIAIASLYQNADDQRGSLRYYDRAIELYHVDPGLSHTIYNNRGMALTELGRFAEAQRQFDRALALARRIDSPAVTAQIYRNIARLKVKQDDLAGAVGAIAAGLRTMAGAPGLWRAQFDAIAADVARRRGDMAGARALIERSFAGTDPATTDLSFREAHYTAYRIYLALGDRARALVHLQAMKRLDDQLWKLTASTNTALLAARFDSANQEARIAQLKADDAARRLALEQAQVRFQRTLLGGIALGALIVLGLLTFGLVLSRRARLRLSASNAALEKALAARTEFLATTSHEIRTPLNGILGMTQVMLADRGLDATARERVGIVHDAGQTMRSLVDDILDVAKMESGKLTVESRAFDLSALLADVTRMWAEQARAKGLDFRLNLRTCPRDLMGDAGRVRQVIYNLLSNAVKFTATGTIALDVTCGDGRLQIVVADTGIGIDPAKHAEIFESFRQADGATTRQFGGTGLGLAIVRNIAAALGGTVRVDSVPGQGATFTVDLPFVVAPSAGDDVAAAASPAAAASGGLLVVDPNPISRAMLKAVLAPRAGTVGVAASLAEARGALAAGGFARVLVDEAAARDDADAGGAATSALAAFAAAAGVPVAVLWRAPDAATHAALHAAGIATVVAKPIAGPALAATLYPVSVMEPLVPQAA